MMRERLREAGVTLRVRVPTGAFWQAAPADAMSECEHVIDATFVDDEAIVLVAESPGTLDRHISKALCTIEAQGDPL